MYRILRLSARLLYLAAVLLLGLLLALFVMLLQCCRVAGLERLRICLACFWFTRLSAALPLTVRIYGEPPRDVCLWVSNHVSWLDIAVLGQLAPVSFLAKSDVRQWPVLGWLAGHAGTCFIRRGAGDSAQVGRNMASQLRDGRPIILFPEGTTSDGQGLRTFYARLFGAALESGVAVQPLAIRYRRDGERCGLAPFVDDDDLLRHLLRLLAADRAEVEVHLLTPLPSEQATRNQLAKQAQAAIAACLQLPATTVSTASTGRGLTALS